jgi:hypothetical protein
LKEAVEGAVQASDVDELSLIVLLEVAQFLFDFNFGHEVLLKQSEVGEFGVDFLYLVL